MPESTPIAETPEALRSPRRKTRRTPTLAATSTVAETPESEPAGPAKVRIALRRQRVNQAADGQSSGESKAS